MAMGLSKLVGDQAAQNKHNAARQGSDPYTGMNTPASTPEPAWQNLQDRQRAITDQNQNVATPQQQPPMTMAGRIAAAMQKKTARQIGLDPNRTDDYGSGGGY